MGRLGFARTCAHPPSLRYSFGMRSRVTRLFVVLLVAIGPVAWSACKKEEPPPTPTATDDDEDEKPKKKKKKADDEEDDTKVGEPTPGDEGGDATPPPKVVGTGGTLKPSDAGSASDADKAKLIACCTALRNTAKAAGVASAAASNVIPGMPAPPPKEELDKAVKACDEAVVNWSGDLNQSLKNVKGASPVKLPSSCYI